MRRFELTEGTSNKFWQIDVQDTTYKVTFGKKGSNGQTQVKRFTDAATATAEAEKVIAEKTKKGYVEIGAQAPTPAPAPKPTPKAAPPIRGWQFVRADGAIALPGPYELAHSFREGVANVRVANKWGLIDREGRFVVAPRYSVVFLMFQGRAGFEQDDKWGYLDASGQVVIEARFDKVTNFDIPGVPVGLFSIDDKWGVIRADGSVVTAAEWDGVAVGKDGWTRVVKKGLSGFLDESGKQVIDCKFRCDNFQEDRALVNVDGKFGFIDRRGELVIAPTYENGAGFREGLACVRKGGKHGWIDLEGQTVIPFDYVGAVDLADGRAFVWPDDSGAFCIDKTGKRVSSTKFGDANSFEHGTAVVGKKSDGPFGLVDLQCNVALEMEYASIDGVVGTHRRIGKKAARNVVYGYVDERGKVVCEPQFLDAKALVEDLAAVEALIVAAPVIVTVRDAPVATAAATDAVDDETPRMLLTAQQIRGHASVRPRLPLVDQVIAVAKDRAAIRKLLRPDEARRELAACPYFWLDALGVDAVVPIEVAIEVLSAHAGNVRHVWQVDNATKSALEDCTAALDAIDSWDATCARVRLFGIIANPEKHVGRSLRALALVASAGGPKRELSAQSFAKIEAEHPGAVNAVLEKVAQDEAPAIRALAAVYGIGLPEASGDEIPLTLRLAIGDGKKVKLSDFWDARVFARPLLAGRKKALPMHAVEEVAVHLENGNLDVAELKRLCDPQSLRDFAWTVFVKWLGRNAPAKHKWALTMLGDFGDDDIVAKLAPLVAEWPGQAAHARAVLGLSVLGAIGTDAALRAIYRLSQRAKFGGLKGEAQHAITRIAKQRGLTEEELADRLVPDLDLDDDGSTTLDFGSRSFRVGFDEGLRPYVIADEGKRLDDLPKPKQSDDATRAAEALATWNSLKKEVRAIASLQLERLEKAMCAERRWHADAFRLYFIEHPLLRHLARRLVWGVYRDAPLTDPPQAGRHEHPLTDPPQAGRHEHPLTHTFRVAEDGSLADASDAVATIPDDGFVGIAHTLDLDAATLTRWSRVFAEYEILQPFMQLARDVHKMTDEERKSRKVTRFANLDVPGGAVMGLLSHGWSRGSVEDNGYVYELHHPLATIRLDPGIAFGMGGEQPNQKFSAVTLTKATPGAIGFSEMVRTLEGLRKPA